MQSEDDKSAEPKPKLRWYQYRLRTLLIIMTIFAAWLAMVSHHARQQKLAVEKIHSLKGQVFYDFQKINGKNWDANIDPKASSPYPAWLRNFCGEDYFQTVIQVDLTDAAPTDADLAILANLPKLEALYLSSRKNTDNCLIRIEGLSKLRALVLESVPLNDNGLTSLSKLRDLRVLVLDGSNITDAGIARLDELTNLEELYLIGSPITDASLKNIEKHKKLKMLMIVDSHITKNGFLELRKELPNTVIYDDIPFDIKFSWGDVIKGIFYGFFGQKK
jgi:hypothetical protein